MKSTFQPHQIHSWLFSLLMSLVLVTVDTLPVQSLVIFSSPFALHTSGSQLLNIANQPVRLSGLNWFGFETTDYAPHGLSVRNWQAVLDQVKSLGYNVIRLPFSDAMLAPNVMPANINYRLNPDLQHLSSLQVMDRLINGATQRGILVILDNHRSAPGSDPESSGLWYTAQYSEAQWIADWQMLAARYKGTSVIGADLRNEPYAACWGCNDPLTDWHLAAERAGDAILAVNPDLLIIVEGVTSVNNQWTWWGGNLLGVPANPVQLNLPNRLVYSVHDFPATVFPQAWFGDPTYPANLPGLWDTYWGYLVKQNIAPVLIGSFGTKYETIQDQQWLQTLQTYIQQNQISWVFWSLNPDSSTTGGLLLDDWLTVHAEKQMILKSMQYPFFVIPDVVDVFHGH